MFKSGYVAVVGRSNVGKSTLLNKLIGEKISIVTNKPQTTRKKFLLIKEFKDSQIIFIDTPGIQRAKNFLGKYMLKSSNTAINDADIILYIVDISKELGDIERDIVDMLKNKNKPVILVINKIDKLKTEDELRELVELYQNLNMFEKIIPVSAINGENIDEILDKIVDILPEGPRYYEEDCITDLSVREIVEDIIREKAMMNLDEELPHGITIEVIKFKKRENKELYDIDANIVVEKKSHKGMVIGKSGRKIKKIGTESRIEIETFLNSKVNLNLWVKINEDWRNNEYKVKTLGYY